MNQNLLGSLYSLQCQVMTLNKIIERDKNYNIFIYPQRNWGRLCTWQKNHINLKGIINGLA